MNIAITVWGNRISPVFDSAQTLLIAEIRDAEIVDTTIRMFQPGKMIQFLKLLAEMEVGVLICGALSDGFSRRLAAEEIEVIPFITGEVEDILALYVRQQDLTEFAMPGCRFGRCCLKQTENWPKPGWKVGG